MCADFKSSTVYEYNQEKQQNTEQSTTYQFKLNSLKTLKKLRSLPDEHRQEPGRQHDSSKHSVYIIIYHYSIIQVFKPQNKIIV